MAERHEGDFCDELLLGLGTDLTLAFGPGIQMLWRVQTETVFFFGKLGLITAQRITTFEFDGWELFEADEDRLSRFEDVRAARARILRVFLDRQADDQLLAAAQRRAVRGVES